MKVILSLSFGGKYTTKVTFCFLMFSGNDLQTPPYTHAYHFVGFHTNLHEINTIFMVFTVTTCRSLAHEQANFGVMGLGVGAVQKYNL